MSSIFTKIIKGEIPSFKIAENDNFIAILDTFPIVKGHVLVIPKKEVDYIFDLSDLEYKELWDFVKKIALAMKQSINCNRIGVSVIGLEVPHVHIHLIPINCIDDMNFSKPKLSFESSEMSQLSKSIAEQLTI